MPSKPEKFGQKYWLAVDKVSKCMVNWIPYLVKEEYLQNKRLSDSVVKLLMHPYIMNGINVTTDSFFTSTNLARKRSSERRSLVVTVNRIRR